MLEEKIREFAELQLDIDSLFYQDPEFPLSEEQQENTLAMLDTIASLEAAQIDDLGRQFRAIQGKIDFYKAEENCLAAKRKYMESTLIKCKQRMLETIITKTPSRKLKGEIYSMTVRQTPAVVIDNLDQLPKDFVKVKTEYSADKLALRKLLKEGVEILGCHLENNQSLVIG